jgi:hypothetical protein
LVENKQRTNCKSVRAEVLLKIVFVISQKKGNGFSKCFRRFPKKETAYQNVFVISRKRKRLIKIFSSFPEKGKAEGFSKCFCFPKKETRSFAICRVQQSLNF